MNVIETIRHDLAFRKHIEDEQISFSFFLKCYFALGGGLFRHLVWFRLSQFSRKNKGLKYSIGVFFYMMERMYARRYGIHANANIYIGSGLHIVHGDSVYLNCKSIGDNCTVYPRVMMGEGKGGLPTIGNNVTIYTGAVISGGVVIEDNCIIGANSVVVKDCEGNALHAGAPSRLVKSLLK